MKVLIVPDKFKGSLSANDVCDAIEQGIHNVDPSILTTKIPLADGGEGSLSVLEDTLKFERISLEVNDPLFRCVKTYYGLIEDTAYIELAKVSGLQLLSRSEQNPMYTSSFGAGEIINHAINKGAKKIYLFVGGSSTNDFGIGIAAALGYRFYDEQGTLLDPVGANLINVKRIDSTKSISLENTEYKVLTDVKNKLFGKNGAAFTFAEQKGANREEIAELDMGLVNISNVIKSTFGIDVSEIPGSGAAGGIGAGVVAFCKANILSGINTILDLLDLNSNIARSDLVITGEGKLDNQTLEGKVINGVIERCKKLNKPIGILCGENTLTKTELKKIEPVLLKSLITSDVKKEEAIKNAELYLRKKSEELINDYLKYIK